MLFNFFIFILLSFFFIDFFVLTPFIVLLFYIWIFFIKNNFYYVRVNPNHKDVLKNSNFLKKLNYNFFTHFFTYLFFMFYLYVCSFKNDEYIYWFNHLRLNNFILYILYIIFFILFVLLFTIKFYKNENINFNIDYFFSIFNLCVFIPCIYLCNNLYTFIFLLEINSILILYKFTVSKYFYIDIKKKTNKFIKHTPKFYMNMLFFQYWVNFFSSVVLFVSIFNILLFLGTSEWTLVNLLNYFNLVNSKNYLFLIYFVFLLSFFVKIGVTPLHLFKIEIYKGLPFISVFFYTIFYFINFFLFFVLVFYYYLNTIKLYLWFFFFLIIILGLFYIISLLFDVNLIKNFFAYSTIINSLTFIILLFVSLN